MLYILQSQCYTHWELKGIRPTVNCEWFWTCGFLQMMWHLNRKLRKQRGWECLTQIPLFLSHFQHLWYALKPPLSFAPISTKREASHSDHLDWKAPWGSPRLSPQGPRNTGDPGEKKTGTHVSWCLLWTTTFLSSLIPPPSNATWNIFPKFS